MPSKFADAFGDLDPHMALGAATWPSTADHHLAEAAAGRDRVRPLARGEVESAGGPTSGVGGRPAAGDVAPFQRPPAGELIRPQQDRGDSGGGPRREGTWGRPGRR